MKKIERIFLSLLLMICCSLTAMAQDIQVKGSVVDKTFGDPVIGATVMVVGTKNGTVTDIDGNFQLTAPKGADIQITYVGMKTQVLKAAPQMNIVLEEDANVMEEVVVTGYQVQRKADLTGAVAVMDMKGPKSEGDPNLLNSLQGKLPGVEITTDATPGSGGSIRVRGVSTVNNASPLYVIDGVATETDFNSLNPDDIESIQVLKDASSASIYGSRAANGVIVVTTKKGKSGKMQVNLNYNTTIQTVAKTHDVLNTQQWGEMYWQMMRNDAAAAGATALDIPNDVAAVYGNGASPVVQETANGFRVCDTDWQKEVYKTAMMHNVGASISNSSDKGAYLMSVNYVTQDGIIRDTDYKRITGRVNSSYNFNKYVRVGENFSVAYWTNHGARTSDDAGIPYTAMRLHPAVPASLDEPNDMINSTIGNPLFTLRSDADNQKKTWRLFGNAYIEVMPIEGLTLKSNIGIEHRSYWERNLGRTASNNPAQRSVNILSKPEDTWTWTNTANYMVDIAKVHHLNALLGVEAIGYSCEDVSATRLGYLMSSAEYMQLNTGNEISAAGGGQAEWGLFSVFGKIDYNYADRYLFSATLRNDKSSRLSPKNNTGIFPAFSGAWRISEENFWPKNNIVDDAKIRLAWGQNGNANIGNPYASYTLYAADQNKGYNFTGADKGLTNGLVKTQTGNPDLKWETTTQTNLGLDLNLFNRAIVLSFDYYWKRTKDMITLPPVLSSEGLGAQMYKNTGTMDNRGLELTVAYNSPKYGDFSWNASVNLAKYKNKIVEFSEGQDYEGGEFRLMKGYACGVYYGYIADGLFRTTEEVANSASQGFATPTAGLGRIKYRDINGDGKITEDDRCVIGDPNPDVTMGINLGCKYKNWSFSMFFSGEFGFDIYNSTRKQLEFTSFMKGMYNRSTDILDAWTPSNPGATIPALSSTNSNEWLNASTYFVEDGSYMKCKYMKVAYDFGTTNWMKTVGLSALNVYFQCENVFTITSYSGLDPEVPRGGYGAREDKGAYPRARNFSLGLNLTF